MRVPVYILCGGLGTRIREETSFRPKPMVPIGGKPILIHIMETYQQYGFDQFILCLGYKGEVVREYFANHPFDVTLVDTGKEEMTGARIAIAAEQTLGDATDFAVTYGDGLTNCNLLKEWEFHQRHQKIGTILGVNPPSRFGELKVEGDQVVVFDEKPEFKDKWINGGYFFFKRDFLSYLSKNPSCILERAPMTNLAHDGQLMIHRHNGFWACMDTQRDRNHIEKLVINGRGPWNEIYANTH